MAEFTSDPLSVVRTRVKDTATAVKRHGKGTGGRWDPREEESSGSKEDGR